MKRNQPTLTIVPDSAWHGECFCIASCGARCFCDMHNWISCPFWTLIFSGSRYSCEKSGWPEISTSLHAVEAVHQHAQHLAPPLSLLSVAARDHVTEVVFDAQ